MSALIDKAALAVVAAAAKDDIRPALAGVRLGNGKAVCADGFRLMAADLPGPPYPDRPPVLALAIADAEAMAAAAVETAARAEEDGS